MEYLCPSKVPMYRFLSLFGAIAMFGTKTPTSCVMLTNVHVSGVDDDRRYGSSPLPLMLSHLSIQRLPFVPLLARPCCVSIGVHSGTRCFLVYYLDPVCERRAPRSGEQGPGNSSQEAT